jgi:hypothetical protein
MGTRVCGTQHKKFQGKRVPCISISVLCRQIIFSRVTYAKFMFWVAVS